MLNLKFLSSNSKLLQTVNSKTPILIIDNYDSFTYNLVHYFESLNCEVTVARNDELMELLLDNFKKIVVSPGSGLPKEAGNLMPFLKAYYTKKSILGICLGQQAIAELFNGELKELSEVKHGVSCTISHKGNDTLYSNIPREFKVGLYYSWHITNLPKNIIATALSNEGIIMSIKHNKHDIRAVQYHPESIMTPLGKDILKNWLNAN